MTYEDLCCDETADGRPEWEVMVEMERRVAVWLAQGRQQRLLAKRYAYDRARYVATHPGAHRRYVQPERHGRHHQERKHDAA
jgi:hypothetical protein